MKAKQLKMILENIPENWNIFLANPITEFEHAGDITIQDESSDNGPVKCLVIWPEISKERKAELAIGRAIDSVFNSK